MKMINDTQDSTSAGMAFIQGGPLCWYLKGVSLMPECTECLKLMVDSDHPQARGSQRRNPS